MKVNLFTLKIYSNFTCLALSACAGPVTPLGALWVVTSPHPASLFSSVKEANTNSTQPKIEILPSHQILHGPSPIVLTISEPTGDLANYELWVRYNGYDISPTFRRETHVTQDWNQRKIIIEKPNVRLSDVKEHSIEFLYRNAQGGEAYARYEPPVCYAFRPKTIQTTGKFAPTENIIQAIIRNSSREGFNPAFLAGMIAQESAFDPNQVSWAKALGLTQVTPAAEKEVINEIKDWPRYPGASNMSAAHLKFLVSIGEINSRNEWRLNPEESIRGGLAYIKILSDWWSTPENIAKIKATFPDPEKAQSELILASYHSGYTRVLNALDRLGSNWLISPDLKEARRYVNRIFSYCDYFVEGETENATAS